MHFATVLCDKRMRHRRSTTRLHELCEHADVSFADLARATGLSMETLRKIASGRRQPLITTALRIAEVLEVEVEDLATDRNNTCQ